ncbi:hypothetical protein TgHK011_008295 [Trichoderma gracile]|nr:hypothetical protein TgHK011_008295 [Trichoderma gracile]
MWAKWTCGCSWLHAIPGPGDAYPCLLIGCHFGGAISDGGKGIVFLWTSRADEATLFEAHLHLAHRIIVSLMFSPH